LCELYLKRFSQCVIVILGAANEMMNHPTTEIGHVIMRGGWYFSNMCNAFEYLLQLVHSLMIGGRALAGWADSRRPCFPPRLILVDTSNLALVTRLYTKVFGTWESVFSPNNRLNPLVETMFASILMYLASMLEKYGPLHIVFLLTVSREEHIDLPQLLQWGALVRDDWQIRNLANASTGSDPQFLAIVKILKDQQEANLMMNKHMEIQRAENAQLIKVFNCLLCECEI
jgi:hypothetical protein